MNNKTKLHRIAVAALLATAFAGSGLTTIGTALDVKYGLPIWLAALLAAAVSGLIAHSAPGALIGLIALAVTSGGWAVTHTDALRAIPTQ